MKFQVISAAGQANEAQASKKEAKAAIRNAMRGGRTPTFDDLILSRGLVIRERENSIFSDAWIPLAILFVIIGLIAGRHTPLIALGVILLLVVALSTWWKNRAIDGINYERSFDRTHVFPGEPVRMTLTVTNDKALPLTWLEFRDTMPNAPQEEGNWGQVVSGTMKNYSLRNTFSLYGYERSQRAFTFNFDTRGFHRFGPVSLHSGDIFTLFTIERQFKHPDTVVVFPRIWPLEELGLPPKEPFGELKITRSLFTDPIKTQGIRDYQPQDRFRDVHWKATARRGSLQTKVYDPSSGMTAVIFLNVATFARHWMGFDPELLERAISVAGSIANYGADQKWGIGLYVNGSVPGSDQPIRVPPSRSPNHLMSILEALAAATEFATGSIEQLMRRESPGLPWGATLLLVTAIVTEEMAVTLMRLKKAGRRIVLISLATEAPPSYLTGILTYHIPQTGPAFQSGPKRSSLTEAALGAIPVPDKVGHERN